MREITWDAENSSFFNLIDAEGINRSILFHRVHEGWRDGALIWERHPEETQGG